MEAESHKEKFGFLVLVVSLILLGLLGRYFQLDINTIQKSLAKIPFLYSAALFILLYVVVTFFIWLSKDVFRLSAAVLFGPYLSTLLVFLAETINGFVLFHFARYLGRGYVEKHLQKKFKSLDARLNKLSFVWLLLFRGVPLVPFRFLDLAMGLTSISFPKYLLVVVLASPVRILWLQYILAGAGVAVLNNPAALQEFFITHKDLYIFSLLYFLLVIIVFLKIKRKE